MIGKTRQVDAAPRGILVPGFASGSFRHERVAPCAALAGLVEHYWFVEWDMQGQPPQQQETLPHPNVHLVIEHDTDGVYGVHTARYTKLLAGRGFAFGVKFRPGGFRPFLGRPVAQMADRRVALASLLGAGGADLVRQVRAAALAGRTAPDTAMAGEAQAGAGLAAPGVLPVLDDARPQEPQEDVLPQEDTPPQAMAALARDFLLARLPPPDADAERAAQLVAAIAGDPALLTVEALAAQAGINKRALQRLFQQYVGVGPKWVIKRYRMHEAVAQLQAGATPELAQLALDLGYFDQAHFVREFSALVGKPPGEYRRALAV